MDVDDVTNVEVTLAKDEANGLVVVATEDTAAELEPEAARGLAMATEAALDHGYSPEDAETRRMIRLLRTYAREVE